MGKPLIKAYTIPPMFRLNDTPGQVPSKRRMRTLGQVQALSRLGARSGEGAANLTRGNLAGQPQRLTIPGDPFPMPGDMTEERLLAQDQPIFSSKDIMAGMGLDEILVAEWVQFLDKTRMSTDNEVVFRKAMVEKLQSSGFESNIRNAILSRALTLWRSVQKDDQSRKSTHYILDLAKAVQADLFGAGPAKPAEVTPPVQASGTYYVGPRGGRWADVEHTIPWGGEHGGLTGQTTILDPKAKDVTRKEHEAPVVDTIIQRQGKAFSGYVKAATEARDAGDGKAEAGAWAQAEKAARNVQAALIELGEVQKAKDWAGYAKTATYRKNKAFDAAKEGPSYYSREEMYGKRYLAEKGERFLLMPDTLQKALFIGPRGGKWADAKHTIPYDAKKHGKGAKGGKPKFRARTIGNMIHVVDAAGKTVRTIGDVNESKNRAEARRVAKEMSEKRIHVTDKTKGEGGLTKEAAPESKPEPKLIIPESPPPMPGFDVEGKRIPKAERVKRLKEIGEQMDALHKPAEARMKEAGDQAVLLNPSVLDWMTEEELRQRNDLEAQTIGLEDSAEEAKAEVAKKRAFRRKIAKLVKQRRDAEARVKETIAVGAEYGNERGEQFAVVLKELSGKQPYRIQWYNSRDGIWGHGEVASLDAAVKELVDDLGTEIRPAPGTFDKYGLLTPKRTPVPKLTIPESPKEIKREPVVETEEEEIRRRMGLNIQEIEAYDPKAAVQKVGKHWMVTLIGGNDHPNLTDTRKEAIAQATRHKEMRRDMYNDPTGYGDVVTLRARESLERLKGHMAGGMTEMEAGEQVRQEEAEEAKPAETFTIPEKPAPVQPPASEEEPAQKDLFRSEEAAMGDTAQVVTPDELLQKGEPRGGSYFKRTPAKKAGKWRYFYKPDDYNKRDDAHVGGEDAGNAYLSKKVLGCVGEKGCGPESFKDLVKKHGHKKVAQVLRAGQKGGTLTFKKGKFSLCKRKG